MRKLFVTIFVFAVASYASAQTASRPAQLAITNAPAGLSIDVFIDGGKAQTAVVNQQGTSEVSLDFLSLGKPQGQVYIETCKDGQRIHIISDGSSVPTEEGCNRKPVGAPFGFKCGKLTLNWVQLSIKVVCGGSLTKNPYVLGGVGATVGGALIAMAGGGGSSNQPSFNVASVPVAAGNVSTNVSNPVPPAQTPTAPTTPTTPPPPAVGSPVGAQAIGSCVLGADPGRHDPTLQFCQRVTQLTIIGSTPGLMNVQAPAVWFPLSGPYDTTSGRFDISGTSTLSGTTLTGVLLRFSGTIDSSGNITGTVTYGGAGLPGTLAVSYTITTRKP